MNTLLIEGNYIFAILLMILIMIGVPIILLIVGLVKYRKNKRTGKIILIIAAVYSLVSFGICGGLGL